MKQEQIDITAIDGAASKITVFTADHAAEAPVLICMPAMGTAARFYEPLALPILREGWRFVTADLRGVGLSAVRVKRGVSFGYGDMVGSDWPAVVRKAQALFPGAPVYLLGHSLGGQLSALYLAANPAAAAGLILVAAPSVHWRGWDAPLSAGVLAGTQAARAVAELLGYFPGRKLGFGGTEARGVIRDWARQARTGRYEPRGTSIGYERLLAELEAPVLAFSFEDDFLSPPRAVGNLLAKMPRARVTHVTLAGDGLDHFRWVRNPDALVGMIREWLPSDVV
ncbi:MAG: alpha/beta fold hydrolase [Syntrophales bacterium]|nr:alpha/beta fold hydrolase [Syntrophales bacterium]